MERHADIICVVQLSGESALPGSTKLSMQKLKNAPSAGTHTVALLSDTPPSFSLEQLLPVVHTVSLCDGKWGCIQRSMLVGILEL